MRRAPGRLSTRLSRKSLRLSVDPLQILEDKRQRLGLALTQQETRDGVQGPLPPLGRVEPLPFRVVHGDLEQGQERGLGNLKLGVQGMELADDLFAGGALVIALRNPAVDLEQIDHGEIGRHLAIRHGAHFQHEPAVDMQWVGHFPQEARLPHPRLPSDIHELAAPMSYRGHAAPQDLDLGVTSHELRHRAPQPQAPTFLPREPIGLVRASCSYVDRDELEPALQERGRGRTHHRLVGPDDVHELIE